MKILVVEDNERMARFVTKGLTEAGHTTDHAENGRDGLFLAVSERYDVIIMDRMLPGNIDGLAIIDALRKAENQTPILILSALGDVDERIKGLRAGGDDYLTKPFAFGELLARIDNLSRRRRQDSAQTTLEVGDLRLDLLARKVWRGSRPIQLQPREFKLLEYLMRHAGQVVTRTMLLENVWDYHFDPETNVVDVHISKLRQKIEAESERQLLRTVRNAGYMISAEPPPPGSPRQRLKRQPAPYRAYGPSFPFIRRDSRQRLRPPRLGRAGPLRRAAALCVAGDHRGLSLRAAAGGFAAPVARLRAPRSGGARKLRRRARQDADPRRADAPVRRSRRPAAGRQHTGLAAERSTRAGSYTLPSTSMAGARMSPWC